MSVCAKSKRKQILREAILDPELEAPDVPPAERHDDGRLGQIPSGVGRGHSLVLVAGLVSPMELKASLENQQQLAVYLIGNTHLNRVRDDPIGLRLEGKRIGAWQQRSVGAARHLDLRIHAIHRADPDLSVWLDGEAEPDRWKAYAAKVVLHPTVE